MSTSSLLINMQVFICFMSDFHIWYVVLNIVPNATYSTCITRIVNFAVMFINFTEYRKFSLNNFKTVNIYHFMFAYLVYSVEYCFACLRNRKYCIEYCFKCSISVFFIHFSF